MCGLCYMATKEGAAMMIVHGFLIGLVLFALMKFALKQSTKVALDRSAVIGLLAAVYMILFGHRFPPTALTSSFR